MRNYEVTFIVDPVLSSDEIKGTAQTYEDLIKDGGGKIVHVNEMGLRQLAYPINRRSSGIYYCIEFEIESGAIISNLELSMRRDERIIRFLTVALDKYGVQYNEDKRNGKIGKVERKDKKDKKKISRTVAPTSAIAEARSKGPSSGPSSPEVPPPAAYNEPGNEEE
ncbi:30S ribosomal protein S6 [Portibacter marinus]|uniref:30S ribosomal protein S6 n=1 Tax=Portibacter marinus TaxID=2898660 RepID=UPI001F15F3F5|nr:30S ribosomal protein S6 [Portibacter marinus]